MKHTYHIGCSGFSYKEWKEVFYPAGLPSSQWLAYYAQHFDCVEINSSFYRMPQAATLAKWAAQVPDHFGFCMKGPKSVTHFRRFQDCAEILEKFYGIIEAGLGPKLLCVLFQLPPGFHFSQERLELIVSSVRKDFLHAIEFRHESWWNEEVFGLLNKENILFCGQSYPGKLPADVVQSKHGLYYRFHGVPVLYKSEYAAADIKKFAKQVKGSNPALVFFNNTWGEGALHNAVQLQKELGVLPKAPQ